MNPTDFAMRRPITIMMLVVTLISGGLLGYTQMRVDIFPSLNVPKIYVFLDYIGMSPDQMEGFIVNELELYFQYVDGIKDIDTRNIQQVALCQLSFFPGTDMGQAMAQVVAMSDRAMSWMPKGTLPPMIMRMDSGSVPVGYLVFESEVTSLGRMGDLANNVIRPLVQKNVPGTVAISPFGPNMRSIVVNVDPHKLLDYNLTPQQLIDALATGNTVIPAGNVYINDSMPMVANNATVVDIQELGDIPLRLEKNVYLRDVATIQDYVDITYGYALVNGKNAVYLPIIKKDTGSTLTVVADVHKSMRLFRDAVPKDVAIHFEFDESPAVIAAVDSVATEGMIGAGLTGLMILLFLGDLRSMLVVVATDPARAHGVVRRTLADGQHDQHHVAGRHGPVDRYPRRYVDGEHRELACADGANAKDRQGSPGRGQRHGRADPAGTVVHPIRLHPGVNHEGPAPVAVHAADPGGRVRDDLGIPTYDHVRTDPLRAHGQEQGAWQEARAVRSVSRCLYQGCDLARAPALACGRGLSRGVRPGPLAGRVASRH